MRFHSLKKLEYKKYIAALILGAGLFLSSCTTVKPYQMAYLNDEDMVLAPGKLELFETNFQTYREGASGGEGGKIGGGCGCN